MSIFKKSENDIALKKQKLLFQCQLAHGSPTGFLSAFGSVKQLYERIAECYDIPLDEIAFCTLNTHKIDMDALLGSQIAIDSLIFIHVKGKKKEVIIEKTEPTIGFVITDNGGGCIFIKKIKEDSPAKNYPMIKVGDIIDEINGISTNKKRHFDVAKILKEVPIGGLIKMNLVEPMQNEAAQENFNAEKVGRQNGSDRIIHFNSPREYSSSLYNIKVDAINAELDYFLGINDDELSSDLLKLSAQCITFQDFILRLLNKDEFSNYNFSYDFMECIWQIGH